MNEELEEIFNLCDTMFANADIDFNELMNSEIDETFFSDYANTRIVNSFLFNFSKIQEHGMNYEKLEIYCLMSTLLILKRG